jgi:hypothetical protein
VKWLALLACLFVVTAAGARIDHPVDKSKPELVERYIFLPCELLAHSYRFQSKELIHISKHLDSCHKANKEMPEYEWGPVMCLYIQLQWQLMYDHMHSVEKAWMLMCNENGERKAPEYEIDF